MNDFSKKEIWKWAGSAVQDYYVGFYLREKFTIRGRYTIFFYTTGLEKICKACLLGLRAQEYESLPEQEARNKIDKIAKGLGHSLKKMIGKLITKNILDRNILQAENSTGNWEEYINLLEKAYTECRYPVPNPVPSDPINLLYSSGPDKFTLKTGLTILKRIESDFGIKIIKDKQLYSVNTTDEDWKRFRWHFFKENVD